MRERDPIVGLTLPVVTRGDRRIGQCAELRFAVQPPGEIGLDQLGDARRRSDAGRRRRATRATGRSRPGGRTAGCPARSRASCRARSDRRPRRMRSKVAASTSSGQRLLGNRDAEVCREPAHLAFEISLQLVVVEQHDVGSVAHGPERRKVMHRALQTAGVGLGRRHRVVDPQPEPLDLRVGGRGRAVGEQLGEIVETHRGFASRSINRSRLVFAMWLSHDNATSRGSRPTTTYVTRGRTGRPSNGVWVLMKRRWVCAARSANTSSARG